MNFEIGSAEYCDQVSMILKKALDSGMTEDEICERLGFEMCKTS